MTETEIRLEVLKLAHTPAREPEAVIERAKEYEQFVTGQPAAGKGTTLKLPGRKEPTPPKGAG